MKKITVIIPCLNEEDALPIYYKELYVLYNNYIYNVYKDGKYRLEGGA